jgi:hypothetical protein
MAKNITLAIPDDIAVEMEAMPEVNWSSVARTSITQYIEMRKNPDITALIEKLQAQKSQEFILGRRKTEEILDKNGYRMLDTIMRKYWKAIEGVLEMEDRDFEPAPWESVPTREEELQKILVELNQIENNVSIEYMKGLKERLFEIYTALPQNM